MMTDLTIWSRTLLIGLFLLGLAGCRDRSYSKYIPSDQNARAALETALTAWQAGKAPGAIGGTAPAIQAVDSHWLAGEKLTSFEIVEEVRGEGQGPKVFSVRLTTDRATTPQTIRYYIVGKDPLWVYREDDYKLPEGM
jgi:hypothetical protein